MQGKSMEIGFPLRLCVFACAFVFLDSGSSSLGNTILKSQLDSFENVAKFYLFAAGSAMSKTNTLAATLQPAAKYATALNPMLSNNKPQMTAVAAIASWDMALRSAI